MLLRILTYNTHLFGETDAAFFGQGHKVGGAWIVKDAVGQPMIYAEEQRRELIRARIASLTPGVDIVALQEVWDFGYQDVLARELAAEGFQYHYGPRLVDPPDPWVNFGELFSTHPVGSGVILFSRFPIKEPDFHRYATLHGEDSYSTKGVLTCTVETPSGDIRIGATQAGTDCGGRAFPHIHELVSHTLRTPGPGRPEPAIMLGDLNVSWVKTANEEWPTERPGPDEWSPYQTMDRIFADVDAGDIYATLRDATDAWGNYRDQLAALLAENRTELAALPDVPKGAPVHYRKPGHDERSQIFARRYACIDRDETVQAANLEPFRKGLAELVSRYGITASDPANLLCAYFGEHCSLNYLAGDSLAPTPTRLDYIYVKQDGQRLRLQPIHAEVLRDWHDESLWQHPENQGSMCLERRTTMGRLDTPHSVDLSDHYPVLATLEVTDAA